MRVGRWVFVCLSLALVAVAAPCSYAGDSGETPEARRARWDSGPQSIDVSGYPPEMQKAYEVFKDKCSQCHNLARPINAEFSPEQWKRYVRRMRHKPGSNINKKAAREIVDFLEYDTKVRKPQFMEDKAAESLKDAKINKRGDSE